MRPAPKPGILDIRPYVAGRSDAPGVNRVFKLSSNEGALGPAPAAMAAFRAGEGELGLYPEGSARALREALAKAHGLDAARVVCGNGSDELLTLLANCYAGPGDEVLFSAHGFLVYRIATLANGAIPIAVPEPDLKTDIEAMLARVSQRTRLVYIANPNNPTGSVLAGAELKRLHAGLPKAALLVIDAAYAEYVTREDYEPGAALVEAHENVVMTRTFSKIHALAGLRVGWAYCPAHVADVLNRVRGPFNVNIAAQRAALASLSDTAHIAAAMRHNEIWRAYLTQNIRRLGLACADSAGNFVLIAFPKDAGRTAGDADKFLTARGIVLRPTGAYGLPNALRITVGTEEANRLAIDVLAEFMARR